MDYVSKQIAQYADELGDQDAYDMALELCADDLVEKFNDFGEIKVAGRVYTMDDVLGDMFLTNEYEAVCIAQDNAKTVIDKAAAELAWFDLRDKCIEELCSCLAPAALREQRDEQ